MAPPLGDLRFRSLLPDRDWEALPPAVRRRFSTRLAAGDTILYSGRVVETRMSRLGWCVARAVRLIGAPLPLGRTLDLQHPRFGALIRQTAVFREAVS